MNSHYTHWVNAPSPPVAMAALDNWTVSGLDVRNAFLYGKLEEEIYMEQPEGFHVPGFERNVLRLKRTLYGLKQAGLAWWRTLRESMLKLGFCQRAIFMTIKNFVKL